MGALLRSPVRPFSSSLTPYACGLIMVRIAIPRVGEVGPLVSTSYAPSLFSKSIAVMPKKDSPSMRSIIGSIELALRICELAITAF